MILLQARYVPLRMVIEMRESVQSGSMQGYLRTRRLY